MIDKILGNLKSTQSSMKWVGDETEWLPMADCEHRRLYRINSRSLETDIAVCVRTGRPGRELGFIGIREKFGRRFLFGEHHWDCKYHATCKPLEALDMLGEGIAVVEHVGEGELFDLLEEMNGNGLLLSAPGYRCLK